MKTSPKAARPAASILAALAVSQGLALAQNGNAYGNATDPLVPVGSLTAFPMLVQTGTHPNLTWDIQYPEDITNIAVVEPGGVITTNTNLCMEVRVLGGAYQIGADDEGKPLYAYLQAEASVDGVASWTPFFYNTQKWIMPTFTYAKTRVPAGSKVSFRGRVYDQSGWGSYRTSGSSSMTVLALTNGASLPQTVRRFAQGSYEDFLKPYLDGGGKVRIGPKDVLILFELGQTEIEAPGFDLQDMALLATFDYCKNNNGHGNNVDGIDASNPGNAPFLPYDTDPTIDDEKK